MKTLLSLLLMESEPPPNIPHLYYIEENPLLAPQKEKDYERGKGGSHYRCVSRCGDGLADLISTTTQKRGLRKIYTILKTV